MKNSLNSEQHRFLFKSSFDALNYINSRAEESNNKYDDLVDKFNRFIVLSESVDNRTSQTINLSTSFGSEDPNDPSVKEFTFKESSVLRYKRVLPSTHKDEYEVVNFKTLINILTNTITNTSFLSKTGDTATGDYTFQASMGGSTITLDGVELRLINNATIEAVSGKVTSVPNNPLSIVNKEYADTHYTPGVGSGSQPVFTSGKIALHSTLSQSVIRTSGKYDVTGISNTGGGTLLKIKLLKYNAKTAWDSTDKSWVELFGNTPQNTIPGYDLPIAQNRIPYPVDFSLYLEYEVDGTIFPFSLINSNSRVRAELSNSFNGTTSGTVETAVIIDSDGDLALILETDYVLNTPWSKSQISINCNATNKALLYLVVNRWSYLAKDNPYIDQVGASTPALLFANQTFNRVSGSTGNVTIRYRLLYANIPGTITWSSDSGLTITYGQDASGYYADIVFPTGETIYNITFTASFTGGPLSKQVALQLKNYSYIPMVITPTIRSFVRYDLDPATLPISFTCSASGGEGAKTWSIISDSDTTLDSAAINSSTGALTGNYIDPDIDVYAKVKVVDSTYATNAGTGTISSSGTLVTIDSGDTSTISIGDYVSASSQQKRITNINSSTTFTIESAFSSNLAASTSYSIIKGQRLQKITISVTENTTGGGGGGDGWCFGKDTYILTTKGGVKINKITLYDTPINLNLTLFAYGTHELRHGKIESISHHYPNVSLIKIEGVDVTINHPYGLANGLWKESASLTNDDYLVKLVEPDTIIKDAFNGSLESDYNDEVWNIHLQELNYFVSSNINGPWLLVHNAQSLNPS